MPATSGDPPKRREWTVTKFSMHKDGYLHCRLTFEGVPYYCTEKAGSWMIPEQGGGYKEILSPYRDELAKKGREFRKAIAKREYRKRFDAAVTEVRASLAFGYKKSEVEAAVGARFKMDKDQMCSIMLQSQQTQLEDKSDGEQPDT